MLKYVFTELEIRNLVETRRAFSSIFLSMAPNYYSDCGSPSTDALLNLYRKLLTFHQDDLATQVLAHLLGEPTDAPHDEVA